MKMLLTFLKEVLAGKELLLALVRRDLTAKYKETYFGFFWNVINPLIMLAVYTVVFSTIFKVKLGHRGVTGSFPLFLFCGLVPWNAFAESLNSCAGVIVGKPDLVKKSTINVEIFPCVSVVSSIVSELIGFGILLAAVVLSTRSISPFLALLPFLIILQAFFSLGLGMFFGALTVFFNDAKHFVGVILTVWFFLTPIVYPPTMIPERFQFVEWLNPMALLISMCRDALLAEKMPDLKMMGCFGVWAALALIGGLYFFRKTKSEFADVI